jgi:F-type H+-transporting ATPase subunit epsilon
VAEQLDLEIVTPTGVALKRQVNEMTAPSIAGEFGVLPGHVPLLAALKPGIVTFRSGGEEGKVAVANGFAQVVNDKALLLTERFVRKEDVDIVAVRARLKDVSDELSTWGGEHDAAARKTLIEEEQWLAAELELIGDPPAPTVREDTRFVQKDAIITETEEPPTGGPLPATGEMRGD